MSSPSVCKHPAAIMLRVLERLEQKCCPQGLHVMVEELQWLGERSVTYDKLWHAVCAELRHPHPRIRRVAEGIYWFTDADIPIGWSLYRDRRMLPCFYRKYPPEVSWDDLDLPENVLPPPRKLPNVLHPNGAPLEVGGMSSRSSLDKRHKSRPEKRTSA